MAKRLCRGDKITTIGEVVLDGPGGPYIVTKVHIVEDIQEGQIFRKVLGEGDAVMEAKSSKEQSERMV
jgi:hypothetical protein